MGLLDKLTGFFSSGVEKVTDSVFKGLDSVITSKEELAQKKLEFEAELNRHLEAMAKEAADIYKTEIESQVKEMDSARNREIQIATSDKAPLINKIIQPVLAILILGSCFIFWYIIIFKDIPKEKETTIAGIVGSLTTIALGIIGYYFGSSMGSKQKQDLINKMNEK